jgi:hypothetical protein
MPENNESKYTSNTKVVLGFIVVFLILIASCCIWSTLSSEESVEQRLDSDAFSVAIGFSIGVLVSLGGLFWYRNALLKYYQSKIAELKQPYEQKITELNTAGLREMEEVHLSNWLELLQRLNWRVDTPEVEMEVKFIFPLLQFLDYSIEDISLQVPVAMQKGSSETTGKADWVIWEEYGEEALVIVEAKAPRVSLTAAATRQARSYAIQLEAPVYIVTNGKQIKVFHRGVIKDRCVFESTIDNLRTAWKTMKVVASKSKILALKKSLIDDD